MLENLQQAEPSVETLVQNIEQYGDAAGAPNATPAQVAPPQEATPPKPQTYKYVVGGKEIEEPLEKVLERASKGYHYAQQMAEVNAKFAEYDKLKTQLADLERFKPYQEYAQQNPQWLEHLHKSYEARESIASGLDLDNPLVQKITQLEGQVAEFLAAKEAEATKARIQQEDAFLANEIESIRKQYSDIDFNAPTEEGKSITDRVIEYGATKKIDSFETAFKALYHDKLVARAADKAKEEALKQVQERHKQGFTGLKTQASTKLNGQAPGSLRGKTDQQVHEMVLKEMGLI